MNFNSMIIALVIITVALIFPIIINFKKNKASGIASAAVIIIVWIIVVPLAITSEKREAIRQEEYNKTMEFLDSIKEENPYGNFIEGKTFLVGSNAYLGFTSLPNDCEKLVFEKEPWLMFSFGRTLYNLKDLKDIEFNYDGCEYVVENGALYNKDKTILYALLQGRKDTSFVVPSSVTMIDSYAFAENDNIRTVSMSNSVTELGESCFYNCKSLESITLSDNIEVIPKECFWQDSNLIDINLPNRLKTVSQYGLASCGFTKIVFPNSMVSVEKSAFEWCRELETLELNNGLEAIGDYAFDSCNKINSVTIPNSVVYLGRRAFSIENVTLPSRFK